MSTPKAGMPAVRRALLFALALVFAFPGSPVLAGSALRLEESNASVSLRLRTEDDIVGTVQEVRGSLLLGVAPQLRVFADGSVREGDSSLPELYLRYDRGRQRFKLGRFYLPLGIHDYSELYYVGFISIPLTKFYAYRGTVPYRSEQGLAWESLGRRWSWEMAVVGDDGSQAALGLERPRGVVGRAQTAVGRWILGFNGYYVEEEEASATRDVEWYGLDLRYSFHQWVVRGEVFTGSSSDEEINSYYVDLLFHPDNLPRWTFLARAEAVSGYHHHTRYTVGARVIVARGWAVSANWIENHVKFPSNAGGLSLQLQRTWQY
jgi:hypothetical protein